MESIDFVFMAKIKYASQAKIEYENEAVMIMAGGSSYWSSSWLQINDAESKAEMTFKGAKKACACNCVPSRNT